MRSFTTFKQFWPFYLSQHKNPINRRLHLVGTGLSLGVVLAALVSKKFQLLWLAPLPGYALAWVGHFFFEKNRPATFSAPVYSLLGDLKMFFTALYSKKY